MSESLRDELVRVTCELCAIPSVADQPEALREAIDYAERYARAIPGVIVERGEYEGKPYVVATLRETRTPELMLNAHLDVVPARPEQFKPEIRDGRIYARASQDMKSSAAVMLRLLKDLAATPEPPDVGFMFVSDEEIGGEKGTGYLAEQGWGAGLFLAAEPTDLGICYAHKGVLWVEIEVPGTPAHGSRPWDGVNALSVVRDGLVALEQRYPTPDEEAWMTTAIPTVITGGDASNRLAANATITLDIRFVPTETPEQIVAQLRECFPTGKVNLLGQGAPLDTDPQTASVQRFATVAQAVTGAQTRFYREHFATDARFYSDRKIPAICLGPVGAGLHSDEEWVEIDSLEALYQIFWRYTTQNA